MRTMTRAMTKTEINLTLRPRGSRLRSPRVALAGLFTCLFLVSNAVSVAWADWGYQVTQQVRPGQRAELSVVPPTTLKRVTIKLTSEQSKRGVTKRLKKLSPGKPYRLKFKPPRGLSSWSAEVSGKSADRTERVTFTFDVLSAKPLKVSFLNQESDFKTGRLVFKSTRALDKVEVKAYGDEGEEQWEEVISAQTSGKRYIASFVPREVAPRRVDLKVYDQVGGWQGFRVVRWYAEVPHEDVLFASGSPEVTRAELPKIEAAVSAVQAEIEKFRRAMGDPNAQIDLQLYVAGYTDTVGDRADNAKLSTARARAIGEAFRRLGVRLPIRYAGFGEGGQLVKTGDSVDEPKNRRATYVVANASPSGVFFPSARWHKLR